MATIIQLTVRIPISVHIGWRFSRMDHRYKIQTLIGSIQRDRHMTPGSKSVSFKSVLLSDNNVVNRARKNVWSSLTIVMVVHMVLNSYSIYEICFVSKMFDVIIDKWWKGWRRFWKKIQRRVTIFRRFKLTRIIAVHQTELRRIMI